jgi:hypothetical protein
MKSYYLFLDDGRVPKDVYDYKRDPRYVEQVWIKTKNYEEFLQKVVERYAEGYFPVVMSLDHDLVAEHYALGVLSGFTKFDETAVTKGTGWHCLKWFLDFCEANDLQLPKIMFHSKNPAGVQNMTALLDEYKLNKYKDA